MSVHYLNAGERGSKPERHPPATPYMSRPSECAHPEEGASDIKLFLPAFGGLIKHATERTAQGRAERARDAAAALQFGLWGPTPVSQRPTAATWRPGVAFT